MKKEESNTGKHLGIPVDSIDSACLLLEYAVQKGLTIDKQTIADIVAAKIVADPSKWTTDIETSFWQAYDVLANVVKPVSIQSLKDLTNIYEGGLPFLRKFMKFQMVSDASKIVTNYKIWTFFFLITLLSAQILFSYGDGIVTQLNQIPESIAKIDIEIQKIKNASESMKTQATNTELGILNAKKESLYNKYSANFVVLERWKIIKLLGFKSAKPIDSKVPTLTETISHQIQIQQDATFILQVMQFYLLPLLYGFIGACAYILRSLSTDIKNVTYTKESKALYMVRLTLGGLSGIAIGWFISPNTDSTIKTISPFALAFIAGYGNEMLFYIMDRIISVFSSESSQKTAVHKQK